MENGVRKKIWGCGGNFKLEVRQDVNYEKDVVSGVFAKSKSGVWILSMFFLLFKANYASKFRNVGLFCCQALLVGCLMSLKNSSFIQHYLNICVGKGLDKMIKIS